MNRSELPTRGEVIWVSYRAAPPVRATLSGSGNALLTFGTQQQIEASRHDSIPLDDERDTLANLGYDTSELRRFRAGRPFTGYQVVPCPANATPLPMVGNRPDPAILGSLVPQVGDWITWGGRGFWYLLTGVEGVRAMSNRRMRVADGRPTSATSGEEVPGISWNILDRMDIEVIRLNEPTVYRIVHNLGGNAPRAGDLVIGAPFEGRTILFWRRTDFSHGHPVSSGYGNTEAALLRLLPDARPDEWFYFCVENSAVEEEISSSRLQVEEESHSSRLQVGDWFTWGTAIYWMRVSRIDDQRIYVDRSFQGRPVTPDDGGSVDTSYLKTYLDGFTGLQLHRFPTVDEPVDTEAATPGVYVPTPEHQADIAHISSVLAREARRRRWCSEYDSIVSEINEDLKVQMTARAQDYRIVYTMPRTERTTLNFDHRPTVEEVQRRLPAGAVVVNIEAEES